MIRKSILYILLFILPLLGNTQFNSSIQLEKEQVEVGFPINATLIISCPKNTRFSSFHLSQVENIITINNDFAKQDSSGNYSNPDVEIRWQRFKNEAKKNQLTYDDFTWNENGRRLEAKEEFELVFWDPGSFKIPGGTFNLSDSSSTQFTRASKLFTVNSPYTTLDELSKTPPNEIKSILLEEKVWSDYVLMYALLALTLLVCVVLFLINRSKNTTLQTNEIKYNSPLEKALAGFEHLENDKPWERNEIKSYHSQLSKIIREYLKGTYGIPALESSSTEIINLLQQRNNEPRAVQTIKEVLSISDQVKFAKFSPEQNTHLSYLLRAKTIIVFLSNSTEEE